MKDNAVYHGLLLPRSVAEKLPATRRSLTMKLAVSRHFLAMRMYLGAKRAAALLRGVVNDVQYPPGRLGEWVCTMCSIAEATGGCNAMNEENEKQSQSL